MEYQRTISKFKTEIWIEVNDDKCGIITPIVKSNSIFKF